MLELPDKISNDIHMHTLRSRCGYYTPLELIKTAHEFGLTSIAITDHGPDLGGLTVPSTFLDYRRTPAVLEGIRVYRGIEANLRNDGTTDIPEYCEKDFDIVLLGLHGTKSKHGILKYFIPPENPSLLLEKGKDESYYTDLLLKAIEGKVIDVLTHPNIKFPLCMDAITEACKEKGIALEFNNASLYLGKELPGKTEEMVAAINKYAPRIVITSDAHCYVEIGKLDAVKAALEKHPIEADVELVNATLASTEDFVEERKLLRRAA